MRHPYRHHFGQAFEQARSIEQFDFGLTILALFRRSDFAAQHVYHELQAIADPEHRYAEIENPLVGDRGILVVNRRRAAGQHDAYRRIAADFLQPGITGKNDGEDVLFADAARNELRILRTKIEDDDGLGFHE